MQCCVGFGGRSISVPLATFNRPENVKLDAHSSTNLLPTPPHAPATHLHNHKFRLGSSVSLRLQRPTLASATKTDPPSGSDEASKESPAGPPLLTILAGLLVFLIVCWTVGSVVMGLLGLFVSAK